MKVYYKWLYELLNVNIPYSEIRYKFSLMSQEVAYVYNLTETTNVVV